MAKKIKYEYITYQNHPKSKFYIAKIDSRLVMKIKDDLSLLKSHNNLNKAKKN